MRFTGIASVLSLSAVLLLVAGAATAQSTWDANSGVWSDGNNWIGGVPNAVGAQVIIGQPARLVGGTVTVDAPFTIGGITFASDANANYIVSGTAPLTFDALFGNAIIAGNSKSGKTANLGGAWVLADDLDVSAAVTKTLTLSPTSITSTDGNVPHVLTIQSPGKLVYWTTSNKDLSGLSDIVISGYLQANQTKAFGNNAASADNPAVTVGSGGRLEITAAGGLNADTTVDSGGTLNVTQGTGIAGDVTVHAGAVFEAHTGGMTGTGAITLESDSVLSINNVNGLNGAQLLASAIPDDLRAIRLYSGSRAGTLIASLPSSVPIVYYSPSTENGYSYYMVTAGEAALLSGHHVTNNERSYNGTKTAIGGSTFFLDPNGARFSATTGTTFYVIPVVQDANSGLLTIGYTGAVESLAKLGTVNMKNAGQNALTNVKVETGTWDTTAHLINADAATVHPQVELAGAQWNLNNTLTADTNAVNDYGFDVTVSANSKIQAIGVSANASRYVGIGDLNLNANFDLVNGSNCAGLGVTDELTVTAGGATITGADGLYIAGTISGGDLTISSTGKTYIKSSSPTYTGLRLKTTTYNPALYLDANDAVGKLYTDPTNNGTVEINAQQSGDFELHGNTTVNVNVANGLTGNVYFASDRTNTHKLNLLVEDALNDANLTFGLEYGASTWAPNSISGTTRVTYIASKSVTVNQDYTGGTVITPGVSIGLNSSPSYGQSPLGLSPVYIQNGGITINGAGPKDWNLDLDLTGGNASLEINNGESHSRQTFASLRFDNENRLTVPDGSYRWGNYYFKNAIQMDGNGRIGADRNSVEIFLNGGVAGAGNLSLEGSGIIWLNGVSTNAGGISVKGSTIEANVAGALAGPSTLSGGTLNLRVPGTINSGSLTWTGGNLNISAPNQISGTAALILDGKSWNSGTNPYKQDYSGGFNLINASVNNYYVRTPDGNQGSLYGTGTITLKDAWLPVNSNLDYDWGNDVVLIGDAELRTGQGGTAEHLGKLTMGANTLTVSTHFSGKAVVFDHSCPR